MGVSLSRGWEVKVACNDNQVRERVDSGTGFKGLQLAKEPRAVCSKKPQIVDLDNGKASGMITKYGGGGAANNDSLVVNGGRGLDKLAPRTSEDTAGVATGANRGKYTISRSTSRAEPWTSCTSTMSALAS
jgi:hypothetical protein